MRVVLQRVSKASVSVDKKPKGAIGCGLLLLVGFEDADTEEDLNWIVKKTVQLRIFNDADGVMNRSVIDVGGDLLIVSQFTLFASYRKGNRPSYIHAAGHAVSIPLYQLFCQKLSHALGKEVETGVFGADMQVELLNDGPVTICMDSKARE